MNQVEMLSEHFSENEMMCFCGCGKIIIEPKLIGILEKVRSVCGPMIINSGYRCKFENDKVGGKPNSAHLTGEAVDICCVFSEQRYILLKAFLALGINRIGIGKNIIHIDISETLPQNVIWEYGD